MFHRKQIGRFLFLLLFLCVLIVQTSFGVNSEGATVVTYSSAGADLKAGDYITQSGTLPYHALTYPSISHYSVTSFITLISINLANDLVDGVRLLVGGMSGFLSSGAKEAVVPIVDDEDIRAGGAKLMGFVVVQLVRPRKLSVRRGELSYDMNEGGKQAIHACLA